MKFSGIVRFRIVSGDITDVVNRIRNSYFSVYNLKAENSMSVVGEINWYNLNELKELATECKAQLEIVEKGGPVFWLFRYKKRVGFGIGAILAAVMIFYFSNIVLRFEISGNETLSDEQIVSILGDYGISVGKFIPSIDIRDVERRVIGVFDNFSWIGIRASGCRIIVRVSEITKAPEMIPVNSPCNIISAKDAQIVDIRNVYMGMLVPMLYDGVKKGDLLISGTVDGKLDHDYYVHAMGEIIGRYDEKVTFYQPFSDTVRNYEEEYTRKSLYFFGLRVPLYLNRKSDMLYDYSEYLNYVQIFELKIPVGIVYSEYKPYEDNEVIYSEEQVQAILEEKIALYEKNFYDGEDIVIISCKKDFRKLPEGIKVTVTYTLEGDIGIKQDIMAKY